MAKYIVIRLAPVKYCPDEIFVEIENEKGKSIGIGKSIIEGPYRLISITPKDIEEA